MRIKREQWPEETYTIDIRHDKETNVVVTERWLKGNGCHREHGPAMICRDPLTLVVTDEKWYKDNQLHRDDGPADVLRKPDGHVYYSAWYQNGEKIPAPRKTQKVVSSKRTPSPAGG